VVVHLPPPVALHRDVRHAAYRDRLVNCSI
jgi:hypothetical protein